MKVYKVQFKVSSNDIRERTVVAPTIEKALENAKRFAKKNYYSGVEIQVVELVMTIDIYYKS
jgi:hypothetical protein